MVRSRSWPMSSRRLRGAITPAPAADGYLLSHQVNDAFVAVNRLLKANEEVYWLQDVDERQRPHVSRRHDVHAGEGVDAADPAEAGRRQGPELRCRVGRARRAS